MKMFRFLAVALAMVATIASCTPDNVPTIKVGSTSVVIPTSGESVTVGYMIENGIDGEKIEAKTSANWLHISTSRVRSIEFSADVNTSNEQRVAKVILSYKGAADVEITVTQSSFDSPLRIEVVSVDSTVLTFSVYSSDENTTYIPYVMPKYYFDTYKDHQQIYEDDIAYLAEYADYFHEMTLVEFLPDVVETGTSENLEYEDLEPSTEYVVYTYGLDANGNRTTELVWVPFTTGEAYDGDITYEFSVSEDDFILEFNIVPSEGSVHYYNGIVSEQTLSEWMEQYETDDIRTAIQMGDIEANIEFFIGEGLMSSRESYYQMFDESGKMDYGWVDVDASTKYIIYACKWNKNCELIGEMGTYEYFTQPISPSNNVIKGSIVEITQSSVEVLTEPSNEDWYTVIPVTSEKIAGMSDEEIFNYLKSNNDFLLKEYKTQGYRQRKFTMLHPDTDYTVVWFGYHGGTMTTPMSKESFRTIASGDPQECTFEFEVQPEEEEAWVEVTPSDKGHFYYWIVCPAYYTEEEFKGFLEEEVIKGSYEGNYKSFVSWELAQGDAATTVSGLYSGADYKVGVVILDYDNFEYLSDVHFSEVFTTKVRLYADLEIELNYGPYYDIDELIAAGHTEFKNFINDGDAVLPISIEIKGGVCNEFYYTIWNRDLTDSDPVTGWTDEMFYESLCDESYSCTYESTNFFVSYDKDMTILAIAYNAAGLPTPIVRELIHLTKEGASPAEEFDGGSAAKKSIMQPAPQVAKVGIKQRTAKAQPRIVEVEEINMEVAMAKNEAAREDKLRAEWTARKALKRGTLSSHLRNK